MGNKQGKGCFSDSRHKANTQSSIQWQKQGRINTWMATITLGVADSAVAAAAVVAVAADVVGTAQTMALRMRPR